MQALLFALLVVPFTVLAAGPAHAAPPDETPFLTWNMQGATAQGEDLWTAYLPQILNAARTDSGGRADVVMLQETGAGVPHGATLLSNPTGTEGNPLVTYVNWHASQRPSEWYMVFLQTNDPDPANPGGRAGGGIPGVARSVTIGAGTPAVPTDVTVRSIDATTVQLNWKGSPEAAGYRVWVRNVNDPEGSPTQGPYITDGPEHQIAFLFPGNWNYEFCITAINGALESGKSSCVHVPLPPPSTGGTPPPSSSSRKAPDPAEEPLLKLGRAAAAQRNLDAAAPIG
ncbi:endonuclease/exonuclease/phosphatase family protein [Streptomyces sp. NPDC021080]|uniref:endonuclease/exonuclease/phosphatase family protein n=1 Tax=Streptomyces sp. NPDC021080 TaxID=3365110 RepID=UPI0037B64FFB